MRLFVRAQEKSVQRPSSKHTSKACGAVTDPWVECEVICDQALNWMLFQWTSIHAGPHAWWRRTNQRLWVFGVPRSPSGMNLSIGLKFRVTSHTSQEPWPWDCLWEPKRKCPKVVPSSVQDWSSHMRFILKGSQILVFQLKCWFKSKTSIQKYRNEIYKLILTLCMNYMVHVSVQCEELRIDHLILLLVVTMPYVCWLLWRANYNEGFEWRLRFQFGVAFWRPISRLKGIEDFNLEHCLGPLHTRAKSRDHEIVRAQEKVSKGRRPNTPPKSCSVVMDSRV